MISGIHFIRAEDCLVTWLRDHLDPLNHADLEGTWVVMPTRRLSGNLMASLAAMRRQSVTANLGGSLIAPRSMNLDGFLIAAAAAGNPSGTHDSIQTNHTMRALPPELPELLLHALIQVSVEKNQRKHVDPSHAHELAHLINSAVDNRLPLNTIGPAATRILHEEIYRSEDQVCAMAERIHSIQETISDFQSLLKKNSLETMEMRRARLAAQIAAIPTDAPAPWKHLIFSGFTSMVPAHLEMLLHLGRRSDVTIALTEPPMPLAAIRKSKNETPLARLANHLCPVAQRPSAGLVGINPAKVTSWIAGTREEEISLAIDLAQELLKSDLSQNKISNGFSFPTASVAILIPDETTYEPIIRKALQNYSNFNLAAPMPLIRTVTGSWFLHMAQFARLRHDDCNEDTRQAAAAFLTHPLQTHSTAESIVDRSGRAFDRESINACMAQAIAASPDIKSIRSQLNGLRNTAHNDLEAAGFVIDRSLELVRLLRSKSLLEALEDELQKVTRSENNTLVETKTDAEAKSAQEAIARILHNLKFLTNQVPCKPATLLDLFVQQMQGASVRDRGEPLTGLQILTLAEARHVPFHTAIIVGCNEGVFPRALPKDRLLDQFLLRRLGLPTWDDLEAIEDTTFHLLRARLSNVIMTCALRDASKHLVPSRYIELMKNVHGIQPMKAPNPAQNTPIFPSTRPLFATPPVNGHIMTSLAHAADQSETLSASALASLITCPFKYALDRQAAKQSPDYESTVKIRQGNWLHRAISDALNGFQPTSNLTANTTALLARLSSASRKTIPPELRDTDMQAHLEHWSWPRLAAFTAKNWTLAPNSIPVAAHGDLAFNVVYAGREFHGEIDRFENLGAAWLLLDYKASNAPKRSEIDHGLRPQLAIYAHAIAETRGLPLDTCIAGHFEIIKGNWVLGFVGSSAKDHAIALGLMGSKQKPATPDVAIESAATLLHWRKNGLTERVNDPLPQYLPDHSDCNWCPHNNICRRDDAAATSWFSDPISSKMLAGLRARRKK